jgi:hypothetical protein
LITECKRVYWVCGMCVCVCVCVCRKGKREKFSQF